MKKIIALLVLVSLFSCGNDANKLTVKGTVKGLKKGTIYLKKVNDTVLVTVDSIVVNGSPEFTLQSDIDEPEMFYLYLNKNTKEDDRISFFADKGVTEINTTLKGFSYDAKIKGSKQHDVLEEYLSMIGKFNNKNLDLTKEYIEAARDKDTIKLKQTEAILNSFKKRKYLYTANFAVTHKDSEVAPYLALSEIYDANVIYLDTISKVLTPEIKASKYGKQLEVYIAEIKRTEQ
ncbi:MULTISPECIES: DUF4369 domain-containing protein [unclassified Olleya]|jgi:hypothetical protein|uniref:DUF4369 domain-containing protein n=1 Tax=unclassified Olleya TaxID=2615019 RepID=UPI0011A2E5D7|nr:DUF4369 domain-containing protein [Olleya sp. Hel_I_94]TVZ47229.1 uncharacterized protein DUF4369 [Olleya sp. Hel_I_94]|tara:strand:+ start:297697 stop:298395 length:699 start_codon:yes stop_codon:yes gene_type:complete